MSRFTQRWSTEQRDALTRAVLDRGITAYRAAKLAQTGDLEDGLAPFPIPYSTVLDITNSAKRRAEVAAIKHGGPSEALDEVTAMMVREVASKAEKLRKKRTATTWNEWREAARAVAEVRKLLTAPNTSPPNNGNTENAGTGAPRAEKTPELVANLRKKQREDFRRERSDSSGDPLDRARASIDQLKGASDAGL